LSRPALEVADQVVLDALNGLDVGSQSAEEVVHHGFNQGQDRFIDLHLKIPQHRFGKFTVSQVYPVINRSSLFVFNELRPFESWVLIGICLYILLHCRYQAGDRTAQLKPDAASDSAAACRSSRNPGWRAA